MENNLHITGRVDCICGNQIISNSGKVMALGIGTVACWGCGKIYDSDTLHNARKDGESVVFESPGKDLKVFRMNDYDWWMDFDLESAKENYMEHIGYSNKEEAEEQLENPRMMTEEELDNHTFQPDEDGRPECTFRQEMQRLQSINSEPIFFASTEY